MAQETKAQRERRIFCAFCVAARLPVLEDSVTSREPPWPDIEFTCGGKTHLAELVEITDGDVARMMQLAIKKGVQSWTAYSNSDPLLASFRAKATTHYETGGAPLVLLAYYDNQYPPTFDPQYIPARIGMIAKEMLSSGRWKALYVFDCWRKEILWRLPSDGAINGADSLP